MSEAFITGSQAYGKPTNESDIDLVVRVDFDTERNLYNLAEQRRGTPLRFGKLNLILCTNDMEFAAWRVATDQMIQKGNVSRAKAVAIIEKLLESVGANGKRDPS